MTAFVLSRYRWTKMIHLQQSHVVFSFFLFLLVFCLRIIVKWNYSESTCEKFKTAMQIYSNLYCVYVFYLFVLWDVSKQRVAVKCGPGINEAIHYITQTISECFCCWISHMWFFFLPIQQYMILCIELPNAAKDKLLKFYKIKV